MTTLRALFKEGKQRLLEAGIEEWELDAWLLLEYAAGCTRNEYYLYPKREVAEAGLSGPDTEKGCSYPSAASDGEPGIYGISIPGE